MGGLAEKDTQRELGGAQIEFRIRAFTVHMPPGAEEIAWADGELHCRIIENRTNLTPIEERFGDLAKAQSIAGLHFAVRQTGECLIGDLG